MSLMFHPAIFEQADEELLSHRLSEVKMLERHRQSSDTEHRCGCQYWLKNTASEEEIEKRLSQPHSVCLPSMNPVIRIAYWLDLMETAV